MRVRPARSGRIMSLMTTGTSTWCATGPSVDAVYLAEAVERWAQVRPGFAAEGRQHARERPAAPEAVPAIDQEFCVQVGRGCEEIRETEDKIVTPAMRRIEAADPQRQLVGLEFRCKGQDRIMEKVAAALEEQPDSPHSTAACPGRRYPVVPSRAGDTVRRRQSRLGS